MGSDAGSVAMRKVEPREQIRPWGPDQIGTQVLVLAGESGTFVPLPLRPPPPSAELVLGAEFPELVNAATHLIPRELLSSRSSHPEFWRGGG